MEHDKKKQFVIFGAVCRLMPTNTDGPWKTYDGVRFNHDVFRMFPDNCNRGQSGSQSG